MAKRALMDTGRDGSGVGRSMPAAETTPGKMLEIMPAKIATQAIASSARRRKPRAIAQRDRLARRLANRLCDGWNLSGPIPLPTGRRSENDNISKRNIKAQNFLRENGPYILEPWDYRRVRPMDQDIFAAERKGINAYVITAYVILSQTTHSPRLSK